MLIGLIGRVALLDGALLISMNLKKTLHTVKIVESKMRGRAKGKVTSVVL